MVASGFYFPEAPRWRDGQLWFSDVFGGLVYSWDPDCQVWVADPMGHRVLLIDEGGAVDHVIEFPGCRPTACALDDTGGRLFVCTAPSIDPAKVQARPGGEIVAIDLG